MRPIWNPKCLEVPQLHGPRLGFVADWKPDVAFEFRQASVTLSDNCTFFASAQNLRDPFWS